VQAVACSFFHEKSLCLYYLESKNACLQGHFGQVVKNTAVRKPKGLQKAPAFCICFPKLYCLYYTMKQKRLLARKF
jgi:hypothetical protein